MIFYLGIGFIIVILFFAMKTPSKKDKYSDKGEYSKSNNSEYIQDLKFESGTKQTSVSNFKGTKERGDIVIAVFEERDGTIYQFLDDGNFTLSLDIDDECKVFYSKSKNNPQSNIKVDGIIRKVN